MTEKTKIKYARKTAELIASFDLVDCASSEVIIHYRDNAAKRIVDRSINVTPDMARYWKGPEWLHFLEGAEESYRDISQLSLDEVASVVIRFKMNPGSLGIYSVENTDIANVDGFNRFLSSTPRTGRHHELFFEGKGRNMKSAHEAIRAVAAMGAKNLRPVASDLPYVCMHVG